MYGRIFLIVSTAGNLSLFPLLFQPAGMERLSCRVFSRDWSFVWSRVPLQFISFQILQKRQSKLF